jgi:hypothetical protein
MGIHGWRTLPIKDGGKEFGYEPLIIWAEGLDVHKLVALAIQVIWVERAHCGQSALVLFVREVRICSLTVPSEHDQDSVS